MKKKTKICPICKTIFQDTDLVFCPKHDIVKVKLNEYRVAADNHLTKKTFVIQSYNV